MRYSVWDPHRRQYAYYEAAGQLAGGVFAPKPTMPAGHRLGVTPDEAAHSLPVGAVLVGRGNLPMGMIASRNPVELGVFGFDPGTVKIALLLGSAYLIYKYVL